MYVCISGRRNNISGYLETDGCSYVYNWDRWESLDKYIQIGGEKLTVIIACFIAGICAIAFVSLWFFVTYHKLTDQYREVSAAIEQRKLHYSIFLQQFGSSNELTAKRMLDTDQKIYREAVYAYNRFYTNPFHRLPGFIMGFRYVKEERYY